MASGTKSKSIAVSMAPRTTASGNRAADQKENDAAAAEGQHAVTKLILQPTRADALDRCQVGANRDCQTRNSCEQ